MNLDSPLSMPGWEMTVTTDTEAVVLRAYHAGEGDVLDVQGFIETDLRF